MSSLFTPLQVGALSLPNRVLMAPLTRCRAEGANVPTDLMAEYYAQRAGAGLIIAEATTVSPRGHGYPNTPGIYTAEQVAGWKKVTSAVHAQGGRIFLQLWHVGRISHPAYQPNGELPVAPSAIKPKGQLWTGTEMADYVTPRALGLDEIPGIVAEYVRGARLAKEAGFDGVEIHNANGYLLDEFLRDGSNRRSGPYGGSIANRARLLLEVVDAAIAVWGAGRVGVRISPLNSYNYMKDSDPVALTTYVAAQLNQRGIAYLHLMRGDFFGVQQADVVTPARAAFAGGLIGNMGYSAAEAAMAVTAGTLAAVAFGHHYVSNPDLVERVRGDVPLVEPNSATLYSSGPVGYTDYPVHTAV